MRPCPFGIRAGPSFECRKPGGRRSSGCIAAGRADGRSIRRLRKLVRHVFGALGLSDRRRTHFLSREIPLPELLRKARWLAGERRLFWPLTHGVPYCACEEGSFHVPRYAHVDVQADGRLRLFSPWPHSFTGLSVLADERAERLRACACGLRAPAFRLL